MDEISLINKSILVVDDEIDLREIISSELEYMGATVFQAENIVAAKKVLQDQNIDLIISDIRMPGGTGIDLLKDIKLIDPSSPPIILITGFADIATEEAYQLGAEALMSKPFKLEQLIDQAIWFTTSLEKRYSFSSGSGGEKEFNFESSESLTYKMLSQECAIGRGGMTLSVRAPTLRPEIGEIVNFTFKFKEIELVGKAICRWCRQQDQGDKITLGFEFLQLSESSLDYLLQYWKIHKILPYIPGPFSNR